MIIGSKDSVAKVFELLQLGDWEHSTEYGNHYFVKDCRTSWLTIHELGENDNGYNFTGICSIACLEPHYRLIMGDMSGGQVSKSLLHVRASGIQELRDEHAETFAEAGREALVFFKQFENNVQDVNKEIDRIIGESDRFREGIFSTRQLIGSRFLLLAIKHEAEVPDLDQFIHRLKEDDLVDFHCEAWIKHYESGKLEDLLEQQAVSTDGDEQASKLMQDHPVYAKSAVCGFVCDKKLDASSLSRMMSLSTSGIESAVTLEGSVIDFRESLDPQDIDLFPFGDGCLVITSSEMLSELKFKKASKLGKFISFRAIDIAATYSIEAFDDGELTASRIDHNQQTVTQGEPLLPACDDGQMELFDIMRIVKQQMNADFWQLRFNHEGIRIRLS